MSKAMLLDVSKCTACRACQVACKSWNDLPGELTVCLGCYDNPPDLSPDTWNRIAFYEVERQGQVDWLFRPVRCLHCAEASCVSVCPTGAAAHRGEFVIFDQDWCIGCGYCVQACPFNVPHRSESVGTARKCTFCIDRVSNGDLPACATACPTGALTWGQRDELLPKAKERVEVLRGNGSPEAHLYGENELGGLGRLSILTLPTEAYGLPELPRYATANVGGQWLSGILTAGVVAAVPFWLLFKRQRAEEASGGGGEQ